MPTRAVPRRSLLPFVLIASLAFPAVAGAHGVQHEVTRGEATVVHLRHVDGTPLVDAACEVRRDGEDVASWVGRTDRQGRFAFVPDEPGRHQVFAAARDGHGARFEIVVEPPAGEAAETTAAADTPTDVATTPEPASPTRVSAAEPLRAAAAPGLVRLGFGVLLILSLFAGLWAFARVRAPSAVR